MVTEDSLTCENKITINEIKYSINGLKLNKSPGLDELTSEFYKDNIDIMSPILLELYKEIEERGYISDDMTTGMIILLFKKGDKRKLENYRPLTMLTTRFSQRLQQTELNF